MVGVLSHRWVVPLVIIHFGIFHELNHPKLAWGTPMTMEHPIEDHPVRPFDPSSVAHGRAGIFACSTYTVHMNTYYVSNVVCNV